MAAGNARRVLAAAAFGVGLALAPLLVFADGAWIDTPGPNWNRPGMAIPAAPTAAVNPDPRCPAVAGRWAESPEDQVLVDAGWQLFGGYQAGWGLRVVKALSGYDGMCRPLGFNEFVFVDGVFAGTVSPDLMDSRADGVGQVVALGQDSLTARFSRYAETDPLCCPSGERLVEYRIDRTAAQPVLAREIAQSLPAPTPEPEPEQPAAPTE